MCKELAWGTYTVSALFLSQFGLSVAAAVVSVLLLVSEALLLLQSQCDPQGPLLLLDLRTVQ